MHGRSEEDKDEFLTLYSAFNIIVCLSDNRCNCHLFVDHRSGKVNQIKLYYSKFIVKNYST